MNGLLNKSKRREKILKNSKLQKKQHNINQHLNQSRLI